MMMPDVVAIVPAAGLGTRFGGSVRKTFVELKGVPLLVHTLRRLHGLEFISDIIPVLREDDIETGCRLISKYGLDKVRQVAPGGQERQDSINNALRLIERECIVMVHDGARPVVSEAVVTALLQNLEGVDGVVPGLPIKETVKEVDGDGIVKSTADRERLRSIQTPQAFRSSVLKKAYSEAYSDGFYGTDDAALVERAGGRVKVIPGDPYNIKVTTREDIKMVEYLLEKI
jgi:2-C-methyl-D-erythritol 4-phosphate cytidylyltransferase